MKGLSPREWFKEGHGCIRINSDFSTISLPLYQKDGVFLCPPPTSVNVAIEELYIVRHKWVMALHDFIAPHRWTTLWRQKLYNVCDLHFVIPKGGIMLGQEEHEPLTLAIIFPCCSHMPWQIWRVPVLLEWTRTVQRLLQENERAIGSLLYKFLQYKKKLDSLPENVVREVFQSPLGRFLATTFTCRWWWGGFCKVRWWKRI